MRAGVSVAYSALMLLALATAPAATAQEVAQTNPGGVHTFGTKVGTAPPPAQNVVTAAPSTGPEFARLLANAKDVKSKFTISASHPWAGPVRLTLLRPSGVHYSSADKSAVYMDKSTRVRISLVGALNKRSYLIDVAVANKSGDPACTFTIADHSGDHETYKCVKQNDTSQQHLVFAVHTQGGAAEVDLTVSAVDAAFYSATVALAD